MEIGWKETLFSAQEKATEKVTVFYPKVVITSHGKKNTYPIADLPAGEMRAKEIQFYSKNGELMKKVSAGYRLLRSEDGKFLVTAKLFGVGYDTAGNLIHHTGGGTIYDWHGNEIGRISSGRIVQVSDHGYVVVNWNDNGYTLGDRVVYDSLGRESGRYTVDIPKRYAVCGSRMSRSNEYIVTVASMFGPDTAIYILWDKSGRVLWQKEFPLKVSGTMSVHHILIDEIGIIGNAIDMIAWDGHVKWQIPLKGHWGNRWSKVIGDRVFVGATRGYLCCVDYRKGELLWQHQEDWSTLPGIGRAVKLKELPIYEGIVPLSNADFIAVKSRGVDSVASTIKYFDGATGEVLSKMDFPNQVSLTAKNTVFFIIQGNKILGHHLLQR